MRRSFRWMFASLFLLPLAVGCQETGPAYHPPGDSRGEEASKTRAPRDARTVGDSL